MRTIRRLVAAIHKNLLEPPPREVRSGLEWSGHAIVSGPFMGPVASNASVNVGSYDDQVD